MSDRVMIIAEAGINHNGDVGRALEMIDRAKDCGADCVKFQTFKADEFVSDPRQTYTYRSQGKEVTESMLEMFRRYEFGADDWRRIIDHCETVGVAFSSTAQNPSDLEFLLSLTDLPFLKLGSDDLTNLELMEYFARKQRPMMISAGMAYASEIGDAVKTIRSAGNDDIIVLHCVSSYPAAPAQVNLRKLPVIRDAFRVRVGFSDHTIGSAAAVGAVCFGAETVEKHFTLDRNLPGPDHWFSIDPEELRDFVSAIRTIEEAIGSGTLGPTPEEEEMRRTCRRKAVLAEPVRKGETITREKLTLKRTGESAGIEPSMVPLIVGRRVGRTLAAGHALTLEDLD